MKLGNESDLLSAGTAAEAVQKLHRIINSRGSAGSDPSIVLATILGQPPFGQDMTQNRTHGSGLKPGGPTDTIWHSKELGQPNGDKTYKWCTVHHWCRHEYNVCRQNPQVKTLLSMHPKVFVKNDSGEYVALMATLPRITEIQKSVVVALKAGLSMNNFVFMDTGAERGICNDVTQCEAGTIRYFDTPLQMVGVGECEYIAEANRVTAIDLGNGIYIVARDPVLLAPKCPFNVASTDDWASIGISTKVDATTSNNQLSVWLPGTQHEAMCTKIGKLWAVPVNPSVPASRFTLGPGNVELHAISSSQVPRRIWDGVTKPIPKQPLMLASVLGYAHFNKLPYDMVTIDEVRKGAYSMDSWADYWASQHAPAPSSGTIVQATNRNSADADTSSVSVDHPIRRHLPILPTVRQQPLMSSVEHVTDQLTTVTDDYSVAAHTPAPRELEKETNADSDMATPLMSSSSNCGSTGTTTEVGPSDPAHSIIAIPLTRVPTHVAPAATEDDDWTLVDHTGTARSTARRNKSRGNNRRKKQTTSNEIGGAGNDHTVNNSTVAKSCYKTGGDTATVTDGGANLTVPLAPPIHTGDVGRIKPNQQIDAAQFRAALGGPSQRAVTALAKRLNIRLRILTARQLRILNSKCGLPTRLRGPLSPSTTGSRLPRHDISVRTLLVEHKCVVITATNSLCNGWTCILNNGGHTSPAPPTILPKRSNVAFKNSFKIQVSTML
jgi:hypothetical protein